MELAIINGTYRDSSTKAAAAGESIWCPLKASQGSSGFSAFFWLDFETCGWNF